MVPEIVLLDNNYNVPLAIRLKCCERTHKLVWEHKSTKTHPNVQTLSSKFIYTFFMQMQMSLKKGKKKLWFLACKLFKDVGSLIHQDFHSNISESEIIKDIYSTNGVEFIP